ncbi:glycosyltransferase family protein [Stieleria varia]|uniref:GDP-mannose:glycolipid 4-beta-D-mannosyltransferase n=1 Tax=Stieleria varia TaxID=2528005 RepID=A0A5C5ZZW3_9BACT|nr:glycosyltransferase [Stieleria varia]TWT92696.1 GDP-mannose:glycolipid 4-beta-D-mannosyltransferase precursor [Stieleria varia]
MNSDKKLHVLAWPARRTRRTNPYPYRVQDSTSHFGVETAEFSPRNILRLGWDVIHVHWPEVPLRKGILPIRLTLCLAILLVLWCHKRLGGSKIAWTTHNLEPHERRDHWLTKWYFGRFLGLVDGTISLSEFGRQKLFELHPQLRSKHSVVVRHGHYRDDYPPAVDQQVAREKLGLGETDSVLLSLGMIRPYKNLPMLAGLVHESDDESLRLLIAGPGKSERDETLLREIAATDNRLRLNIEFLPADEVSLQFAACDLAVLPYSDILNSGSLLLALSMSRRALIPRKGATPEIAELVGKDWVHMYDGELTLARIQESLDQKLPNVGPDLSNFEWPVTGELTSQFFRELCDPAAN